MDKISCADNNFLLFLLIVNFRNRIKYKNFTIGKFYDSLKKFYDSLF